MIHLALRQFSVELNPLNHPTGIALDPTEPQITAQGKTDKQYQHQAKPNKNPPADSHAAPFHSHTTPR
jgi:hypothetical protein